MRLLGIISAAAIGAVALAAAPDAFAQRGRNLGVVAVNYQRVVSESAMGRDMTTKLQQIQTQINTEGQALAPERQSLAQEAQRLAQARRNMTDEQVRNNATLWPQVQQYQQRARQLEVREATLRGDFECSQAIALRDFNNVVNPIVQNVMRSRNAGAVIDLNNIYYIVPENDITAAVIQQLDQASRTANVSRRPVAECLPQQQQQQPAQTPPRQ